MKGSSEQSIEEKPRKQLHAEASLAVSVGIGLDPSCDILMSAMGSMIAASE
jgi:hypothetical protein